MGDNFGGDFCFYLCGKCVAINELCWHENPRNENEATILKLKLCKERDDDENEFENINNLVSIDDKIIAIEKYLGRAKPRHKDSAVELGKELKLDKADIIKFEDLKTNNDTILGWYEYLHHARDEARRNFAIKRRDVLIKEKQEQEDFELVKLQRTKEACFTYINKYESKNSKNLPDVEKLLT